MTILARISGIFNLRRSLTAKLLVATALVVTVMIGAATALITERIGDDARKAVLAEGTQFAQTHAVQFEHDLNALFTMAESLGNAVMTARRSGLDSREFIDQLLRDTVVGNTRLMGAFAAFEPNALDGRDADFVNTPSSDSTGRFLSYWNRGSGAVGVEAITDYEVPGKGDYYLVPRRTLQTELIEPYTYDLAGKSVLLATVSVPLIDRGKFIGVIGVDLSLEGLSTQVAGIKPLGNGAFAIISNSGRWVADARPHFLGQPIEETDPSMAAAKQPIREGKPYSAKLYSQTLQTNITRLTIPLKLGNTDKPWAVLAGLPETQSDIAAAEARNLLLIGGGVLLAVLMLTLGFVLVWLVGRPMGRTIAVIERMAAGDYDVEVPDQNRTDEIGRINQTLQSFKLNNAEMRAMEARQRQAEEDAAVQRREAMLAMADRFESDVSGMVSMVASAAAEMERTATTMSGTAAQVSQQAQAVAAGSNQAAANVQTVAAATDELSASISEVTKQMSQSSSIAARAVSDAQNTDQTIASLAEAVSRIGTVVDLITSIAGQTNLLALNATIEAARAGEAGKGFAVVASEVKSLANQTAKATDEIASEINRIQSVTGQAVQAISVISGTIDEMSEITGAVAAAAEEQAAATNEITRNLQEAAHGTQNVSANITGVSQGADESGAAAERVLEAATELGQHAERLRQQVDVFIARIRENG